MARIPNSMHELGPMLSNYELARPIYQGEVTAADGSVAIIFASNQMLRRLNDATEIHADGTFEVVYRNLINTFMILSCNTYHFSHTIDIFGGIATDAK